MVSRKDKFGLSDLQIEIPLGFGKDIQKQVTSKLKAKVRKSLSLPEQMPQPNLSRPNQGEINQQGTIPGLEDKSTISQGNNKDKGTNESNGDGAQYSFTNLSTQRKNPPD